MYVLITLGCLTIIDNPELTTPVLLGQQTRPLHIFILPVNF